MALEFVEICTIPIFAKSEHEVTEMRVSRDSLFRYYVRIGKSFYDSFDEVWRPTKEGCTLPLTIESAQGLMLALASLLSLAETRGLIDAGFKESLITSV